MTQDQKKQIKSILNERIEDKNLSANQASKQIGISAALLSNLLNDKWDQISDQKWMMVAAWVGFQSTNWVIRETRNTKAILNLCQDARNYGRFMSIAGDTGLGKTTALRFYTGDTPNAFYVLCTAMMSRKDFLSAILRSMGLEVEGQLYNRTFHVVSKLRQLEHPILILDDFGKLSDHAMTTLQVIYDELEGRCGFVIAGLNNMKSRIYKMAAKDKPGFRELKRRIGYWQPLYGVTDSFVKAVCADYGITDPAAISYITRNCTDYGSLRELITNYARFVENNPQMLEGKSQKEVISGIKYGANEWEAIS